MIQFNLFFLVIIFYFFNMWFLYDIISSESKFYLENKYSIQYIYLTSTLIIILAISKQYFNLLQFFTNIPLLGNIFSLLFGICIFFNLYYSQVILEKLKDNNRKFNKFNEFTKKIINYFSNLSYLYLIIFTVFTYYTII